PELLTRTGSCSLRATPTTTRAAPAASTVSAATGLLADVRLAFAQAGVARPGASLPADVERVRKLLPEGFVREFIEHLAMIEVDVVRLDGLSTAYSFTVEDRPVILLPESGNWFHENWSLAHELGHLALGHEGVIAGATGSD